MKITKNNKRKYNYFKYIGATILLVNASLLSLGYSSWLIGESYQTADINNQVSGILNASKYLTVNQNFGSGSGIEKLEFNSTGFVYNGKVSYIGHLKYHLIFDAPTFYLDAGSQNKVVNFKFELSYKDGISGTNSLINPSYLTATISETFNSIVNNPLTLNFNSNISVNASTNNFNVNNTTEKLYLTLDYIFDVKNSANFENVKNDQLKTGVTLMLTTYLGGGF